jgi:hypothetical protein
MQLGNSLYTADITNATTPRAATPSYGWMHSITRRQFEPQESILAFNIILLRSTLAVCMFQACQQGSPVAHVDAFRRKPTDLKNRRDCRVWLESLDHRMMRSGDNNRLGETRDSQRNTGSSPAPTPEQDGSTRIQVTCRPRRLREERQDMMGSSDMPPLGISTEHDSVSYMVIE